MAQVAETFTRTFHGRADADMIERPEPEAVDGEAAAADSAGYLREGVKRHVRAFADAEDPDFGARRANETNRRLPAHGKTHSARGAGKEPNLACAAGCYCCEDFNLLTSVPGDVPEGLTWRARTWRVRGRPWGNLP